MIQPLWSDAFPPSTVVLGDGDVIREVIQLFLTGLTVQEVCAIVEPERLRRIVTIQNIGPPPA